MNKHRRSRAKKIGLPPGSLIHTGEPGSAPVAITLVDYDRDTLEERQVRTIEECFPFRERPTVTWIDIDGLHQVENIRKLGDEFGIHPLFLEDILNPNQRPKLEDHETYLYIVLKMLVYDGQLHRIEEEQLSLILGENYVISLQEKANDPVLNPVRERLRSGKGRLRRMGADYLAYTLLDTVVDNYFVALEEFGDYVDDLEEKVLACSAQEILVDIQRARRDVLLLRRTLWPLRELLNSLQKSESERIDSETRLYLKDVHDHVAQIIDEVEAYRETITQLGHVYLSNLSNQMNQVMKVLTVFAAIFIPLTFIVGVYGMNFAYMPELKWPWAYPVLWLLMLGLGAGMFYYFYRKKWL